MFASWINQTKIRGSGCYLTADEQSVIPAGIAGIGCLPIGNKKAFRKTPQPLKACAKRNSLAYSYKNKCDFHQICNNFLFNTSQNFYKPLQLPRSVPKPKNLQLPPHFAFTGLIL